ncbi:glutamate--tRNA ligase family protein [Flammeovirga kamogawensis]|uniref:tRNA glutamyl-Q synthetase n=1 Tax=Flammeovirga kamogawensis TaxID=373891 RepID=A0ABX8GRE4_9BACT|nr:glutamate--tRNA ligase family protein [Flammeovirga kamogawensis]MBB6463186.1 glutamyl-tRNA synthetase [Flammeovirga kamogawensis]QWG05961.1 tRNA glutamyl-Q synthetase [Flammeovirga kamogawensis]TRX67787.1 tRNA glutamyl-Q synthetase [Flammeovirga kamogawensis]
MRTRFAPTPSGYLHIGNAYSFILTWIIARQNEGEIILRIDDIDSTRCRDEYLEDIFTTIDWLGLDFDNGPSGVDDFHKNWTQKLRYHRYQKAFDTLKDHGDLFACNCSRKEIYEQNENGIYTGKCTDLSLPFNTPDAAVRVKTTNTPILLEDHFIGDLAIDLDEVMKDFIIRRKDGLFSYQLASLIDDEDDNVDFIVRGEDLIESTAAQIFLSNKLELPNFENVEFFHHPLLVDENGNKISKSDGADSIRELRAQGMSPQEIYNGFAEFFLGEEVEINSIDELLDIDFLGENDYIEE